MKRYILSLIAAATMLCAQAQTEVLKINLGDTIVTYKVADIQEMTFDTVEEQADTTLFHSFNGYITVSTAYFTDTYYGNDAQLGVFKTSEDEYLVTFSDPTWGDAFFGHVQIGQALSAEGTIKMFDRHSGGYKNYDCTLSGPMTTPVITVPGVMGGTSITFHVDEPPVDPELYVTAGQHKGGVTVMVGGQFGPYTQTDITYGIEDNGDGTINVVIPGFQLSGTVMGDLTLGAYTVSNVAYDAERGAYYRDYSADGLTFHLTAVNNGATTMDNDYDFTRLGTIEVKATEAGGVSVVNTFQPGAMPFPVESVFEGNIE